MQQRGPTLICVRVCRSSFTHFLLAPRLRKGAAQKVLSLVGRLEVNAMPEIRYCLNCSNIGPLNIHGRCETCDSDAVVFAGSMDAWDSHSHDAEWDEIRRREILAIEHLFRLTTKAA